MNTSLVVLILLAALALFAGMFVVGIYNMQRKVFPSSVIAGMFHFTAAEFFAIEKPEQREATKVSFA